MISHEHRCIFIHISKCAGSSIENSFGIDVSQNNYSQENLHGWDKKNKVFLQHATPQELFDLGLLTKSTWDNYFKFIIIRNPWDRAFSDYIWVSKNQKIKDSFINFINGAEGFHKTMNIQDHEYRGDHLTSQVEYFQLNGKRIKYDRVLKFENLQTELKQLARDLGVSKTFFDRKVNVGKNKMHYSKFYSPKRKRLVEKIYKKDIDFFDYDFEEKKKFMDYFESFKPSHKFI